MGNFKPYEGKSHGYHPEFRTVAERVAQESFKEGYDAHEEECLGIALAQYFEWDGLAILRVATAALEDANFHTEAALIQEMLDKEENR